MNKVVGDWGRTNGVEEKEGIQGRKDPAEEEDDDDDRNAAGYDNIGLGIGGEWKISV